MGRWTNMGLRWRSASHGASKVPRPKPPAQGGSTPPPRHLRLLRRGGAGTRLCRLSRGCLEARGAALPWCHEAASPAPPLPRTARSRLYLGCNRGCGCGPVYRAPAGPPLVQAEPRLAEECLALPSKTQHSTTRARNSGLPPSGSLPTLGQARVASGPRVASRLPAQRPVAVGGVRPSAAARAELETLVQVEARVQRRARRASAARPRAKRDATGRAVDKVAVGPKERSREGLGKV